MPSTGTRLFKIATQINVGKETIIDFLEARGFKIENKATATLTDEMVDLVLGNFQKEYNAAVKQRAKITPVQKEADIDTQTPEPVKVEPVTVQHSEPATVSISSEPMSIGESNNVVAESDVESIQPSQSSEESPAEDLIPVGTVIQLEDIASSRRVSKSKKKEPLTNEEPTVAKKTTKAKLSKSEPSKSEKTETSKVQEEVVRVESGESPAIQTAPKEPVLPLTPLPEAQAAAMQSNNDVGIISETETHTQEQDLQSEQVHDDSDGLDPDHDEGLDGSGKKRRRKRMGEIEYQAGEFSPASMIPGLTILGKIDLGQKGPKNRPGADKDKAKTPQDKKKGDAQQPSATVKVKGLSKDVPLKEDDAAKRPTKKKRKKNKREQISADEVDRAIRRTLSGQDDSSIAMRSKLRQKRRAERAEEQERQAELRQIEDSILRVTEYITVAELANMMGVQTNDIIVKCMSLGLMVSINQRLDKDTIQLIADDYNFSVEFEEDFMQEVMEEDDDPEELLQPRAPIVTVMGHVDHGKTSLLDYIRKTSVVTGESGGITQHIGAYSVKMPGEKCITFLDTPGHQAFTAMRARGAQVTDIVVLVVAADDNVMPQTIEAISHARAASVPMIVAINKIDKPDANPDKVRQQLADHNVLVEEWGGKFQCVEISAKKGINVEQLLDKILLEAELLNLRSNPDRLSRGTVIEAKIDKGKGPVATVIVQKGTLRIGDPFICGVYAGRVRAMLNENGERIDLAPPSTPLQILGLDGVPQAGDIFAAMDSESNAKTLAIQRQQIKREQDFQQVRHVTLDDIAERIKSGGAQELRIILKGDTDGSVEALADSLQKLSTSEVHVAIIYRAVGPISESDVMLAAASDAVIIGFHIRPTVQAAKLAENESVDIRLYRIIYDCINEVQLALEGMLLPEIKEEVAGVAEIRDVFRISKVGNIAGCYMLEGKITRNDVVRLVRDGFEIFSGKISSLKRLKDDVREVDSGFECGISLDGYNDIKVGDIIEAVKKTEVKRKLA